MSIADDEELESDGLSDSEESEDEDSNHHLLTTPSGGELTIIKEKPMTLARDLL